MSSFFELANQVHDAKVRDERWNSENKTINGDKVYTEFCIWCNVFNKSKGKNDPETFGRFLKEQHIEINFWQKKHIAEKHFNWVYKFDYQKNKWNIKRKVS